jgi:ApaG protein
MATYDLTVTVRTRYLPEQSKPERDEYLFSYTITIRNTGDVPAQLISRHWVITDANNRVQEVSGLGVVGHQPLLKPGEEFEYSSGTPLATPQGSMHGEYFCVAEDGHRFDGPPDDQHEQEERHARFQHQDPHRLSLCNRYAAVYQAR